MASASKCPYCGGTVRSDEKNCPGCGASNDFYVPDAPPASSLQPKTMEELKAFCAERHLPLLRMRFFIGENYREPKAFGIYRDGDEVVVYKNKADGSRAVRYRGPDEAHGVNELYQKMLSECHNRGIYPEGRSSSASSSGAPVRYDNSGLPDSGSSEYRGRQSSDSGAWNWLKILLFIIAWIVISSMFRSCTGDRVSFHFSGSGSSSSYSDRSWDDDDDWDDDWDDDDTDWDSDW